MCRWITKVHVKFVRLRTVSGPSPEAQQGLSPLKQKTAGAFSSICLHRRPKQETSAEFWNRCRETQSWLFSASSDRCTAADFEYVEKNLSCSFLHFLCFLVQSCSLRQLHLLIGPLENLVAANIIAVALKSFSVLIVCYTPTMSSVSTPPTGCYV